MIVVSSFLALMFWSILPSQATSLRRASPNLSITLAASNVSSIADLKIEATVRNNGAEDVSVLKYATVLDGDLPTRSFKLTKDGQEVQFIGAQISVQSLSNLTDPDQAIVTIPAGQSIQITHSISGLYDFEAAGTGTYSIDPSSETLDVVTPTSGNGSTATNGRHKRISDVAPILVSSTATSVNIAQDVAKRSPVDYEVKERDLFNCDSIPDRVNFMNSGYSDAILLAALTGQWINVHVMGATSEPNYRNYFKSNDPAVVFRKFQSVWEDNRANHIFSCNDRFGVCANVNVIAYTWNRKDIYYCNLFFFELPVHSLCTGETTVSNRNVRGGTVLHELTHAVAGTNDVAYGCENDQQLQDANQLINADNYNCFATQVSMNYLC